MSYIRLIPIALVMFILCSCNTSSNTDNPTETTIFSSEENTNRETKIDILEETSHQPSLIEEQIHMSYNGGEGYLYDFDLDGICEVFYVHWGWLPDTISLFKMADGGMMNIGENLPQGGIPIGYNPNGEPSKWFTISNLALYHDMANDEYFYVSEYDVWEKFSSCNEAEVNKYLFKDGGISVTNIARCEFNVSDDYNGNVTIIINSNKLLGNDTTPIGTLKWDEVMRYYDGIEEYLSQFELIKTITFEELTAVSVEDAINSGTLGEYFGE
jgi:hypothetical protein